MVTAHRSRQAAATLGFNYTHTMLRIKDAQASLDFYTRILGMTLVRHNDYENGRFSLYFLTYLDYGETPPSEAGELRNWLAGRSGVLELTHNWGSEKDADFSYHTGNEENGGYGHICLSVPDFAAAIEWFDENGVSFTKRPHEGRMKNIAFIADPDGYRIEIIRQ